MQAEGAKPPLLTAAGFETFTLDESVGAKYNKSAKCREEYDIGRLLGNGAYASVRLGAITTFYSTLGCYLSRLLLHPMNPYCCIP
jgi:hypothetical protein